MKGRPGTGQMPKNKKTALLLGNAAEERGEWV